MVYIPPTNTAEMGGYEDNKHDRQCHYERHYRTLWHGVITRTTLWAGRSDTYPSAKVYNNGQRFCTELEFLKGTSGFQ